MQFSRLGDGKYSDSLLYKHLFNTPLNIQYFINITSYHWYTTLIHVLSWQTWDVIFEKNSIRTFYKQIGLTDLFTCSRDHHCWWRVWRGGGGSHQVIRTGGAWWRVTCNKRRPLLSRSMMRWERGDCHSCRWRQLCSQKRGQSQRSP